MLLLAILLLVILLPANLLPASLLLASLLLASRLLELDYVRTGLGYITVSGAERLLISVA